MRLDATASRVLYATYLGGGGDDLIRGIAVAESGEVVVVGRTSSTDFPVTAGVAHVRLAGDYDGFVVKLAPAGAPLPDIRAILEQAQLSTTAAYQRSLSDAQRDAARRMDDALFGD